MNIYLTYLSKTERIKLNTLRQISKDNFKQCQNIRNRSKERLQGIHEKIEQLNDLFYQRNL